MADDMRSPENRAPRWVDKLPGWVKPVVLAGGIATAIGGYAVTRGEQPQPVEPTPTPSAAAASPTPEATPTMAPTATPTAEPTPTPTPEIKKEVPCLILEQKYCDQAQRIILDINGTKVLYIAFNLPPEIPFTTPINGLLVKGKESGNLSGFVAQIRKEEGGAAIFRGDIKFDDMIQKNIAEGNIVAHMDNTGIKIGKDSNFNLAFTLTKRTSEGPVVDEEALKKLFPKAFEKPVLSGTAQPAVTVDYGSTPPPGR